MQSCPWEKLKSCVIWSTNVFDYCISSVQAHANSKSPWCSNDLRRFRFWPSSGSLIQSFLKVLESAGALVLNTTISCCLSRRDRHMQLASFLWENLNLGILRFVGLYPPLEPLTFCRWYMYLDCAVRCSSRSLRLCLGRGSAAAAAMAARPELPAHCANDSAKPGFPWGGPLTWFRKSSYVLVRAYRYECLAEFELLTQSQVRVLISDTTN